MRAFLEAVARRAGWAPDDVHRLTLILEELFTNTVRHGGTQSIAEAVTLTLAVDHSGRMTVDYQDRAPPHNPFERVSQEHLSQDIESRRVGSLGIPLILALAEDVRHVPAKRGNRITFTLRPRALDR